MGKKGKGRKNRGDDSDDEVLGNARRHEAVEEPAPQPSRAEKRAQKKDKKGNKGSKLSEPDDDASLSSLLQKLNAGESESVSDEEADETPPPQPVSKKGKKGKKGKGGGFADLMDEEDEEDEEDEIPPPQPVSKKGKKGKKGKGGGFADLMDEEDEEDEEDEIPPPQPVSKKGKKGKKGKGGGFADLMDEEDEEDEEDEIPPPQPVSKKGKKGKKGKGGGFADLMDEEDEEDEEDEIPPPQPVSKKGKKGKKGKGGGFADLMDEEDEEDEEDEIPPPQPVSKKGTKGKGGGFADLMDEEDEEDEEDEIPPPQPELPAEGTAGKTTAQKVAVLSKAEKAEYKELKARKDNLTKDEKKRYKELKARKRANDTDTIEVQHHEKQVDMSREQRSAWPPKAENTVWPPKPAAAWPPPSTTLKLGDVGSSDKPVQTEVSPQVVEDGKPAEEPAPKQPKGSVKMTKLQKKMEAARLKRQEAEQLQAEKQEKEREIAKQEARRLKDEARKNAQDQTERNPEDLEKRVFNIDAGEWKDDGGLPPIQVEEDELGDIPEYGEDGKKLTKKEIKKLLRDREMRRQAIEHQKEQERRSREGAQFACSQTAVDPNDPQWQNSLDISIPSFTISAYNKNLFVDASLSIAHGRHYGLVGPNGKGKSTLLKMIASGALNIPPRVDCLYVEQEVQADDTPAVLSVLQADKQRWSLMQEEKRLVARLAEKHDEALDTRLGVVYEELAAMDAAAAEPKARRILFGLGFDTEMQNRPTREFSGGWRMRISLARALFIEPTLLMLDEPTNHLDLNAVIWLDDYLQKWKKTLLVVSHDQDFLNSVCQEIVHLNDQKLETYRGNYDTFKQMEEKKREQQQKAWEQQERRLKQLKASGVTKAKAAEQLKSQRSREQGGSKKKKNSEIASGQAEAETKELVSRPREYQVVLHFAEVPKLSPPIIQVMDVSFRYAEHLPNIFNQLNFGIDMDSRVCVVGNNGSGKSTLIKLLTGEVQPTTGEIRRNPRLRVGVYNQHFVDKLPMTKTPVEYLRGEFDDLDYQSARNLLGKFGLEGHAHEICMRDLSGGQKARVTFCELTLLQPHILFLDEPTNNLDIESIDALCEAINEYEGGMVVVTHDARLIEATESQLWVVEDKTAEPWDGEFDSYREELLRRLEVQMEKLGK